VSRLRVWVTCRCRNFLAAISAEAVPRRATLVGAAVSVVMTLHNGHRFLAEQVASILAQLETGDELIAIDDASTDDSVEILRSFGSSYIHVHSNSRNQGVARSIEQGLRLASAAIIFLSDQDDVWLPGKRRAFVAEFERDPSLLVVISDAVVIDADDEIVVPSFMRIRRGFKGGVASTLWRSRYLGCAMAIRRSLLNIALPIPPSVPMHDMWLGALGCLCGEVRYIDTPYLKYRRHGANVTSLRSAFRWGRMLYWRISLVIALFVRFFWQHRRTMQKASSKD
jgi:glycosyltransferase involved in cell wall biosynthesis